MKDSQADGAGGDWYRHYGFDRDPFAEGGVLGLFYPGGARQETVEQLQHLARFSDCTLLVTGVAGSGKSATRRHFVAQSAPDTRCCVIEAALLDGPEQWLRRVLDGFGIRPAARPDLETDLELLTGQCATRQAGGSRSWLVVDDAQHLHEDVIEFLPRVLERTGRNLRLVFFAEPVWREILQAAMPPGAGLHTIELQPLDAGECHAYIHYRLNTAGLEGEPPFNAEEFERIHRQSAGLPGRINMSARQVLTDAASVVEQPLSTLPLWHFGVIAATLLALLLLYVWSELEQGPEQEPVPRPGASLEKPAEVEAAPDPGVQILSDAGPSGDEEIGVPDPGPVIGVALPGSVEAAGSSPVVDAIGPSEEDAEDAVAEVEAAEDPPVVEAETPAPAPVVPVVAPPPAAAVEPEPSKSAYVYRADGRAGGATTADEEHLLGLNPGHYLLQIMGSDDAAKVRSFASRQRTPLRVYRKLHNGQEWYALVYGDYADRAAAERAAQQLPPELAQARPWVRRLDAVQKEIRSARAL